MTACVWAVSPNVQSAEDPPKSTASKDEKTADNSDTEASTADVGTGSDLFTSGTFTLPKDKQNYIWEIEHLAVVLNQDIVPLMRDAIRGAGKKRVLGLFARDFQGRLFAGDGLVVRHGAVTWTTWKEGRDATLKVDSGTIIKALAAWVC